MAALPLYGATGKFTWRMAATVLAGQSVIVFFGALLARALAATRENEASSAYLLVGGLAVLCLVAAGLMRRPYGVSLGWVIQALTFLSALVVPAMLLVGVIFTALWVLCLWQGQRIDAIQAGQAPQ